jgi:nucleotide-binding universal stress UspA family protein
MYRRILVPVDNSKHSDAAIRVAARFAERFGSTVTGFHAYAARLHESRFQQMEPGLPERYQEPVELERQRSVHETLISEGLRIVSDSYLDHAEEICRAVEVPYERRLAEGRNYVEILREIQSDGYDLVAMGALGLGASRRSLMGGVSERVLRRTPIDGLVVRKPLPGSEGVMAATDGSACSFKAVDTALQIGKALEQPVEVVSVFDPDFHIAAFQSIAKVLSEEGAKIFRFREQEKLHEEIIDKGLENLYREHLNTAGKLAKAAGQTVETSLLAGKPFQRVLEHVKQQKPSLLVVGRFGLHRTEDADIGNTAENLVRLARCSVLVVAGELDSQELQPSPADEVEQISWTREAEANLQGIPPFARGMAMQAIEDYARDHGYGEVTPALMTEARAKMGM